MDKANELKIPIIEIPKNVAYIDIISPILREIEREQYKEAQNAIHLQNQVNQWIIQGKDFQTITTKISKLLDISVITLDKEFNIMSSFVPIGSGFAMESIHQFISKEYLALSKEQLVTIVWAEENQMIHIHPIKVKGRVYGFTVAVETAVQQKISSLIMESISTGLGLLYSQTLFIQDATNKMKKDLLDDWLSQEEVNSDVFLERSKKLSWSIFEKSGIGILSCSGLDVNVENILQVIRSYFQQKGNQSLTFIYGEKIVFFLQSRKSYQEYYRAFFEELYDSSLADAYKDVHISLSPSTNQLIKDGRFFYEELTSTIHVQKKLDMLPKVLFLNEVPIFSAQFLNKDKRLLRKMDDLLAPLIQYDEKNNSDLLETLGYLLFSKDFNELPEKLNIHKNTLNYRKNRIKDLLPNDPFVSPYRISYELAFLIKKISL
ncbi:helix-turn-helix domain-containing protein [Bacillus sp. B1-b2]|uniref:helix-turn-helix domain-containing protein n=1 Tax=Bacillus sp. B1-b2 TaxID=2653201 RepID=UPI001869F5CB|nr:hypothetical protein [Bacillus sp. B1-b2]